MKNSYLLLSFIGACVRVNSVPCPSMCNGHGLCVDPLRQCNCFEGYQGGDCSELICPFAPAWTDQATAIETAHNEAECSNMGLCDRATGLCQCREGFEGKACERKSCPNGCNGNGKCQSMRYYADVKDPGEGTVYEYKTNWDAEMIYGCNCDRGYHGPDCSLRYCPKGDDPLTGNAKQPSQNNNPEQLNEVQEIYCRAQSGYFTLAFRGKTTDKIPFDAKAYEVQNFLQDLVTVGMVKVDMAPSPGQACSDLGSSWTVEFLNDFGDVPLLVPRQETLSYGSAVYTVSLTVAEKQAGTKEDEECSNRGICDSSDGYCSCETGYDTSNGYDEAGQRGDCGFVLTVIQQCPGVLSCSGHGKCNDLVFRCECSEGWTGADCSERVCPRGTSWFTRPTEKDNLAHVFEAVECSDMGVCNRESGECQCMLGFTGASCNRLMCPPNGAGDSDVCSGHGQCHDMSTLAELAEVNGDAADFTYGATPNDPATWDAFRMQGCHCDALWTGYDCSLRTCPFGDDPNSGYQADEIQSIMCTDSDGVGTVVLTYKQHDLVSLDATTTAAELAAALEALDIIDDVKVDIDTNGGADSMCTPTGSTFHVQFLTEHGDLPMLQFAVENVDSFEVEEYKKGTKEHWECSGRGLCDRSSGECTCFQGFGSSDGKGQRGNKGDCGYIEPILGGEYKPDS